MIDPTKIDMNRIPKRFVDAGLTGHSKEAFMWIFSSGDEIVGFATTPMQFKANVEMFVKNLEIYEKNYGVIEMNKQLIPSPIQMDSLGGGKKL